MTGAPGVQDEDEDPEARLARQNQSSFQLLVGAGVHPGLASALSAPAQDSAGVQHVAQAHLHCQLAPNMLELLHTIQGRVCDSCCQPGVG